MESALAVLEMATVDDMRTSATAIDPGRINSSPNSRGYFPAMIPVKRRELTPGGPFGTKSSPLAPFDEKMARNSAPRLRASPILPPLHVVLVEPENPPHTGNIARLCAATGSVLHLVRTLAVRID